MEQMHFKKKAAVLSVLFTIVILCGMMLFAASASNGNKLIPEPKTPEELLKAEELSAREELLRFEKIKDAIVSFGSPDDDVSTTYVFIIVAEEISDSEMNNITKYIQENFDHFENGQVFATYIDSSYNLLNEVYPEAL